MTPLHYSQEALLSALLQPSPDPCVHAELYAHHIYLRFLSTIYAIENQLKLVLIINAPTNRRSYR